MLKKRIIPCLDVKDGRVVKGLILSISLMLVILLTRRVLTMRQVVMNWFSWTLPQRTKNAKPRWKWSNAWQNKFYSFYRRRRHSLGRGYAEDA